MIHSLEVFTLVTTTEVKDIRTQEQLETILATGRQLSPIAKKLMLVRGLQVPA